MQTGGRNPGSRPLLEAAMKKTILATAFLALVALAAPRPAAAHVSFFFGLPLPGFGVVAPAPVVVAPPVYAPPVYYGGGPYVGGAYFGRPYYAPAFYGRPWGWHDHGWHRGWYKHGWH